MDTLVWRCSSDLHEMRGVRVSQAAAPLILGVLLPIWTANKSDPLIDPLVSLRRSMATQLRREDPLLLPGRGHWLRGANTAAAGPDQRLARGPCVIWIFSAAGRVSGLCTDNLHACTRLARCASLSGAGGLFSSEMAPPAGYLLSMEGGMVKIKLPSPLLTPYDMFTSDNKGEINLLLKYVND